MAAGLRALFSSVCDLAWRWLLTKNTLLESGFLVNQHFPTGEKKRKKEQRWKILASGCPSAGTRRVELGPELLQGMVPVPRLMLLWGAEGWEGVTGTCAGSKVSILAQSLPAAGDNATCNRWLNSLRDYSQMLQLRRRCRVKNLTTALVCARGQEGVIILLLSIYPDILANQLSDGEN